MDLSNDNVIHVKMDGVEFLQFRRLLQYKDILSHAYSLDKNMNFRTSIFNSTSKKIEKESKLENEKTLKDYKILCDKIGSDYMNVVKPIQKHTDNVKCVLDKINRNIPDFNCERYENTDGLITNKQKIVLSTTSADCISLLFFDPVKIVIANVHSGWKGTLQRIAVKTVHKMENEFDCNPKDLIVCICPSIRKCHFEVERDVKELFEEEFNDLNEKCIIEEKVANKKWNIDTVLINKIILQKEGVKRENIIDSKICTVCNSKVLHSYRVEKQNFGLNVALIELKGEGVNDYPK